MQWRTRHRNTQMTAQTVVIVCTFSGNNRKCEHKILESDRIHHLVTRDWPETPCSSQFAMENKMMKSRSARAWPGEIGIENMTGVQALVIAIVHSRYRVTQLGTHVLCSHTRIFLLWNSEYHWFQIKAHEYIAIVHRMNTQDGSYGLFTRQLNTCIRLRPRILVKISRSREGSV